MSIVQGLVLDASATLALLFEEVSIADRNALDHAIKQGGAVVPQLWHLEIANILLLRQRKGWHDLEFLQTLLADLSLADIIIDSETCKRAWSTIVDLAAKHSLTSYDAAYLELAMRKRLALATLDKELIRAAEAEAVPLFWS